MKDQHEKIKGYRDLSQSEIDLMNRIKDHGEKTAALIAEFRDLRSSGVKCDHNGVHFERTDGLTDKQAFESDRCLALAETCLQTGQMWFVRAVALPDSF